MARSARQCRRPLGNRDEQHPSTHLLITPLKPALISGAAQIFAAVPADATHAKLVEGETPADLAPLVDWIGRLRLPVIAVAYRD